MYGIVEWEGEGVSSVISLNNIVSPRKEVKDYQSGERVKARFSGRIYFAEIQVISENKKELDVLLRNPPAKVAKSSRPIGIRSKFLKDGNKSNAKKDSSNGDSIKENLQKEKLIKKQQKKVQSEQAKERKQALLNILDSNCSTQEIEVNAKGHPKVAQKQPRKNFCTECVIKEKEILDLKTRLQAYEEAKSLDRAVPFERPKEGVISSQNAKDFNMIELQEGTGVYVYPSTKSEAEGKIKDNKGDSAVRFLMSVFFKKQELANATLSSSNSAYIQLNKNIMDAIYEFAMVRSKSKLTSLRRVAASKITMTRTKYNSREFINII